MTNDPAIVEALAHAIWPAVLKDDGTPPSISLEVEATIINRLAARGIHLMEGWQPISEAHKDIEIMLVNAETGEVHQGRWIKGYPDGVDEMGHDDCWQDNGYRHFTPPRSFGNPDYQTKGHQPTHWMPLPPAPKKEIEE